MRAALTGDWRGPRGKGNSMRKNSIKNTRINMEVQRELSEIIRTQVKDPRLKGAMVTVTGAEVSPDLKYCKVYISVLGGGPDSRKEVIEGLKSAVGFIRRELAARVNLRNTPEITFVADTSIEYGVNMTHLINEVTKDLKDDEPEESAGQPEDPSTDESADDGE